MTCAWLAVVAACGDTQPSSAGQSTGATASPNTPATSGMTPGQAASGASGAGASRQAASSGTAGAKAGPGSMSGAAAVTAGAGAPGASGTSAAAGTTSTGAAAASGGMFMDTGPYFASGVWHGYAFTSAQGTGSSIMPMDFSMLAPGQPRCAMGTVGPAADYSGVAMLGVNLNQAQATDAPKMTVTPSKSGLMVDVKNNASSALRIQIETPNGGTNENERWCAPFQGTGFIPWKAFNTKCWDGSGASYMMEPISSVLVLVPGDDADPVAFDFCLNSVAEADGAAVATGTAGGAAPNASGTAGAGAPATAGAGAPTMTASAGAPATGMSAPSGMITERYGVAMVQQDGRNYVIQNNVWGDSTTQHIRYDGTAYEIVMQTGANVSSGSNAMGPVSYPSVFIGSNFDRTTAGSNLPIQISAIKSVKTAWTIDRQGVSGTYNASYDVWFSTSASGDSGAPSGGYLMVWYYKPPDAQPIGSILNDGHGVTVPGVSGTWDVWVGPNTGNANRPVISYVATQPIANLEFDLNAFIQDAVKRPGALQASWYLSNVFAGFEIWSGGVGLKTKTFSAIVE